MRLGGGARLNFGLRGPSVSFGTRGAGVGIGSARGSWLSLGIPGTGISYISYGSRGRRGGGGRRASSGGRGVAIPAAQLDPVAVVPRPGLLASETERRFREGVVHHLRGNHAEARQAFEAASSRDTRNVSDDLFLAVNTNAMGDSTTAIAALERVVGSDVQLPDELMRKYLPAELFNIVLSVGVTDEISAEVPFDSAGAVLSLAELYQKAGRPEEAIGLIQQTVELRPDAIGLKLQLCDLLYDADDFEGVLEVAAGVQNEDDLTLAMLHLRAKALANLGQVDEAARLLGELLRKRSDRDIGLLRAIRYNRAEALELLGDSAKARGEWSRIYAEDPAYRDVRDRVRPGSGALGTLD